MAIREYGAGLYIINTDSWYSLTLKEIALPQIRKRNRSANTRRL